MHEAPVIEDQATRLREIALHASLKQQRHESFVISIASGKGGVGKSTDCIEYSDCAERSWQAGSIS